MEPFVCISRWRRSSVCVRACLRARARGRSIIHLFVYNTLKDPVHFGRLANSGPPGPKEAKVNTSRYTHKLFYSPSPCEGTKILHVERRALLARLGI